MILTINKKIIFFVFLLLILKIIIASYLPLINDEAYAIAVSKNFSLSFFDHPPLGFWSSSIFTNIIGQENPILYRLPYIFYGIATSLILYKIGETLYSPEVGNWSVILYNIAPFFFFSGGLFVVPDGPLNLGIVLVGLSIITLHSKNKKYDNFFLIILGLSLAVCFLSKYQGFLIGLGCIFVLVVSKKRHIFLKNPYLYICFLLALIGIIPTIIWNYNNEWISFQFQSSRHHNELNILNFFLMLFGLMIYLLPQTVLIPIIKTLSLTRYKLIDLNYDTKEKFLVLLSLPNVLLFLIIFFSSDKTFPHWIIPGWLLLIPLISKYMCNNLQKIQQYLFFISSSIIWTFLCILIIHSQTGIITNNKSYIPKWDNTFELIDWTQLQNPLEKVIKNLDNNEGIKLAAFTWTEAGQISTLMNNKYEIIIIDGDAHHFQFMKKTNQQTPTILVKLVLGTKPNIVSILNRLKAFDNNAQHINNIIIKRGNRDYATATIFLFNQ